MLEKITIRGFKSIASMEGLELKNINVLVGGNGAGKSNLIEFFKMLRAMQGFRLAEFGEEKPSLSKFLTNKGGLGNFLFGGIKRTKEIYGELMFNGLCNGYSFSIGPTAEGEYSVRNESFYYKDSLAHPWFVEGSPDFQKESVLPSLYKKAIAEGKETRHKYIYEAIQAWQIYQFHDTSQFAGARQASLLSACDELYFDGGNLAAFLYALKEQRLPGENESVCKESYEQIVDMVRVAAPYFEDFVLEPFKQGDDEKVKLQWKQQDMLMKFQPHHISDGTLRFMCLSTVLLQPKPPKLIIVDEPELGLHPEALEALAELIRRCCDRTQFILATQSPSFADFFEPDEVLTVNRVNGASVFERQSRERLGKWLESYSVGQLWRKNVIRGGLTNG